MKILVIGGAGTIGKTIVADFSKNHDVIVAGRSSKDYKVDIADTNSIKALYRKIKKSGRIDAIICAAGDSKWAPMKELSEADYHIGLRSKLMGQVNIVRYAAAMVNGGIHSFVRAAAIEMRKKRRVNVVSSGVVIDAYDKYESYFPGHPPIEMDKMLMGYRKSVLGRINGEVIKIYS